MRGSNPTITTQVPGGKDADSRCSIRSSACSADRFFHCFHDPLMRRTPAEIVIQYPDNFIARCFRLLPQKRTRRHDHTRCAIAALESVVIHKCLLNGVQGPVSGKAFDCCYFLPPDFIDGNLARSDCLSIEENGAGAAVVFPAAVLRACQTKVGSEDPEKFTISVDSQRRFLPVECERNALVQ